MVDPVSGALVADSTPIASCTGYVMMDITEYSDYPTLSSIFAVPLASDLQSMWMIGFSLPVIFYLTAWAYQTVISFFR